MSRVILAQLDYGIPFSLADIIFPILFETTQNSHLLVGYFEVLGTGWSRGIGAGSSRKIEEVGYGLLINEPSLLNSFLHIYHFWSDLRGKSDISLSSCLLYHSLSHISRMTCHG